MLSLRCLYPSLRRGICSINAYANRTHTCGELDASNEGQQVTIMGWLEYKRMNRFIVLRDAYGSVQATIPSTSEMSRIIKEIPYESVVKVEGKVKNRGADKNEAMKTGEIEIDVSNLEVLNRAQPNLPLDPNGKTEERTRLRYRYLDIRGDRLQRSLRLRSQLVHNIRRFLVEKRGFVDVETPTLFRRTPGGAAEFVVPASGVNLGSCYSLPQSPQQFKQLLMVGGIDRYFQIARCYRDEGSKGDRQPEFTQVDLEVSFCSQEGVMNMVEEMVAASWPDSMSDLKPCLPFPKLTYETAMRLYGSDKPDMRIPWAIEDCSRSLGLLRGATSPPSWCAKMIVCRGQSNTVTAGRAKEWKRLVDMNQMAMSFTVYTPRKKQWFKGIDNQDLMREYGIEEQDAVIFCWGNDEEGVHWTLGQLRNLVAEAGGLRRQRKITCHWVVDFPLFSMEDGQFSSTHHPFTAPIEKHKKWLYDTEKLHDITGQHYDLVINGVEMGGGSIRIHNTEEQKHVLQLLGEDYSEMNHLLEALSLGAPPHGGFALGLDRFVALMTSEGDPTTPVREVIAFPKSKDGRDVMSGAPVEITEEQQKRYGIEAEGRHENESDYAQ